MVSSSRTRLGAALIAGGFIAVWVALMTVALTEGLRHHRYAWLLIIPVGLWALRALINALNKVLRQGILERRPGDSPKL